MARCVLKERKRERERDRERERVKECVHTRTHTHTCHCDLPQTNDHPQINSGSTRKQISMSTTILSIHMKTHTHTHKVTHHLHRFSRIPALTHGFLQVVVQHYPLSAIALTLCLRPPPRPALALYTLPIGLHVEALGCVVTAHTQWQTKTCEQC